MRALLAVLAAAVLLAGGCRGDEELPPAPTPTPIPTTLPHPESNGDEE